LDTNLSFEQAPPISAPYRFFLTAPWFSFAAGILVLVRGEAALSSRWMPETLALTHLLVAGFMLQAMCGALMQFVPVAAGGNVWRPSLTAGLAQPLIFVGALLLSGGLLWSDVRLLLAALPLLLVGVGVFVVVIAAALWRTSAKGGVVACLRLAIVSLAMTVAIGALLAGALVEGRAVTQEITAVHAGWGLGGWALALLTGVSLHVVPMFQMTKPYPQIYTKWIAPTLAVLLIVWSGQWLAPGNPLLTLAGWGLFLVAAIYAIITIQLQMQRRRKLTDITFWFFRGGMVCLIAAAALCCASAFVDGLVDDPRLALSLGVLVCGGGFISAINGMLYKIVPFINWLGLQALGAPPALLPNMKQMIPQRSMRLQMVLHFLAVGLFLLAIWLPMLSRPAGAVWAVSAAWLGINLMGGARRYLWFRDRIRANAPCPES
jgi:hypothetical protein